MPPQRRARPFAHRPIDRERLGDRTGLTRDAVRERRLASFFHHLGDLVKRDQPFEESLDGDLIGGIQDSGEAAAGSQGVERDA